jgi:hypothetical protein
LSSRCAMSMICSESWWILAIFSDPFLVNV